MIRRGRTQVRLQRSMSMLPWARGVEPPDPATLELRRVLLASEGRRFSAEVIDVAARLAEPRLAQIHVFSIARVWGTSLGLPNPGLLPSKQEWDAQRALVEAAVSELRRRGIEASGHVVGTRSATRRILGEASRLQCGAIVMAADPPRHWILQDMMWSQEAYRVRRRATIPVYLVSAVGTPSGRGESP